MDEEQRKYFADMMGQLEGVASDARAAASTSRETAAGMRKIDQRLSTVEGHVSVLHTHVFGKPPTSNPPPPAEAITSQLSEHDNDIATMAGQLIAVHAKVDTLTAQTSNQTAKLGLEPNSAFLAFIRNANVKDLVKILTLVAAIIAAWKGLK